jgi:hypothetical protein
MAEQQPRQVNNTNEHISRQRNHWLKTARKTGHYVLAMGVSLGIGSTIAQAGPKHKTEDTYVSAKADRAQLGRVKTNRFLDAQSIIMAADIIKLYATKSPSETSYSRKPSSTMEEIEIDISSTAAPGFKTDQQPTWHLQTFINTGLDGQLNPDKVHAIYLQTNNSQEMLIKGPDPRIRGFRPTANSFSVVGYNVNSNNEQTLVVVSDYPKPKEQFMTFTDAEAAVRTDLHFIQSATRHAPVSYIPIPFPPKSGVVNPIDLG